MSSEWLTTNLYDVINIIGGGTPKRSVDEYWNGNIPWLSVADFNNDLRKVNKAKESITELGLNKSSTKILKEGQIIISARGTVGELAQIARPMAFNQSCYGLDAKKEYLTNDFLYYLLKSKVNNLKNVSHGSVFDTITRDTFKKIEVSIPPINHQNKIAHILSTLDNKIELNKKINQTMESVAQAIFKSWFVDFDPVYAKASANSEDEYDAIAKELSISREILDLFPNKFEESEQGLIPKGWNLLPFGDFLEKSIGGDWGKDLPDTNHTEQVRIIRGTDLSNLKICSFKDIPTRYVSPQKLNQRKLKDGDLVIEISGGTKNQPTGRSCYITSYMLNALGRIAEPASFCRLFRPTNPKVGLILGLHLKQIYDENKTWKYQNQSTGISNFQTTVFLSNELVVNPSNAIIDSFFSLVRPLIDMAFPRENLVLENIKNTLLPKLISGEIDVSNLNLEPEHD